MAASLMRWVLKIQTCDQTASIRPMAGQIAGMSGAAALEFSFFLSMPTMAVAT